ncbi:hypothetical protein, partial [Prosthecobacter sp.]|uniref:hypothetical protein n=1 Tax=Prosthecobacter sp. TaxID=1965333 RepID=UPI0037847E12
MKTRRLILATALMGSIVPVARADSFTTLHSWLSLAMQIITRDHPPLPYPAPPESEGWRSMGAAARLANVRARLLPKLKERLAAGKCQLGQAAFIRIFKESRE